MKTIEIDSLKGINFRKDRKLYQSFLKEKGFNLHKKFRITLDIDYNEILKLDTYDDNEEGFYLVLEEEILDTETVVENMIREGMEEEPEIKIRKLEVIKK